MMTLKHPKSCLLTLNTQRPVCNDIKHTQNKQVRTSKNSHETHTTNIKIKTQKNM